MRIESHPNFQSARVQTGQLNQLIQLRGELCRCVKQSLGDLIDTYQSQ